MRRALAAVAVATLLALAGCTAPFATDEPSSTSGAPATDRAATPSEPAPTTTGSGASTTASASAVGETRSPVAVRGGALPVNATRVFERVERIMGANVTAPASVRVTNASAFYGNGSGSTTASASGHGRLERALGLAQAVNRSRVAGPNGATVSYGTVAIYPGENATAARASTLLAHEFAHYVQFRQGRATALAGNLSRPRTTDAWFVRRAVVEGVAVAVETAYARRYAPTAETGIERSERALDRLPAGSAFRYRQLPYVAGYRYVTARYGTPANATGIYGDPPQTSEQVLHATRDAPVALDVTVDDDESAYRGGVADRLGEAYLRVALANAPRNATDGPEAAPTAGTAAAGWGEDALVVLRKDGTANHAWILRFDTVRDVTEAERALAAVLDARGDRARGERPPADPIPSTSTPTPRWRLPNSHATLHRPANRTLVLAVGSLAFLADLAVTGTPGAVMVAVDGANGTTTADANATVVPGPTLPRAS
ncbi:hypothetical protein [Halorubellus salinus]|uniref:hypothetical protein n=1 Tax=Halorubellus salinus TaxID=755309 RepID=UPI001D096FDC|nr:hypothetical protein [Halorubellus salinus]